MNKLIITADDLGFSPSVNNAVIEAYKNGVLTAASLMVNMPFAEEAALRVQNETPKLGLGLHLCLTSGAPVCHPSEVPLLVDKNGNFKRSFPALFKLLNFSFGRKKELARVQVEKEILAQFDRMRKLVRQYNLVFDHLDSHQHIHFIPGIDAALWRVYDEWNQLRDKNLPPLILRNPVERFGTFSRMKARFSCYFPGGLAKKWILQKFSSDSIQLNGRRDMKFPGYFGILETGRMTLPAWKSLVSVFHTLPLYQQESAVREAFRAAEINLHPSMDTQLDGRCRCSKADAKFHQSPCRREEFQTLIDNSTKELLEQNNIIPAAFTDLY